MFPESIKKTLSAASKYSNLPEYAAHSHSHRCTIYVKFHLFNVIGGQTGMHVDSLLCSELERAGMRMCLRMLRG